MTWTLVSLDAARPQPWRNGAGLTRELLAWPEADAWKVRMSVADVQQPGSFSRFPGVERWFAVLEGEGVLLRMPRVRHRITRHGEPLQFDGGLPVDCRLLRGPTRDFNLMAPPGTAIMCRLQGDLAFATGGPTLLAVYAHSAAAQVRPDGGSVMVPPYHLGWSLQQSPVSGMVEGTDALWMEATP